jgi:hypothetical protein
MLERSLMNEPPLTLLESESYPKLAALLNERRDLRNIADAFISYTDWLVPLFRIINRSFTCRTKGVVETTFVTLALKELKTKATKVDITLLGR